MDLERLKEFIIITEEQSLKKAAERIGVSSSTLSARYSAFEKSLNVKLLDRNPHKLELTSAGKLFLKDAKDILRSYDKAVEYLHDENKEAYHSLRLMICSQVLAPELGPFLDIYCRRYPQMFLELYDENTCTITEGLTYGRTDIVFTIGRKEEYLDISGRLIITHFPEMNILVPTDHRLAAKPHVQFSDLSGETFILYPKMKEGCIRNLQLSILEQSGIEYGIYKETCSPYFYPLLVPIGKGIRLWNWTTHTQPNTKLIPVKDRGYDTYMYLLYNEQTKNKAAIDFINSFMNFRKERL